MFDIPVLATFLKLRQCQLRSIITDYCVRNSVKGKGKVFYGQEPPSGESTTTGCGFYYQLLAVFQEKFHRDAHNRSLLALLETIHMRQKYPIPYPTGRHYRSPVCPVPALLKQQMNKCRALSPFLPAQLQ